MHSWAPPPAPRPQPRWWPLRARLAAATWTTWLAAGQASSRLLEYPTTLLGLALLLLSALAWVATLIVAVATLARTDWSAGRRERSRSAVVAAAGAVALAGAAVLVVAEWIGLNHTGIGGP